MAEEQMSSRAAMINTRHAFKMLWDRDDGVVFDAPGLICPWCDSEHAAVYGWRLPKPRVQPDGTVSTHWAPCPTTGAPIHVAVALTEPTP